MNLFELQTRANILVDKVNEYESSLTTNNINEDEVLAQQKYADIYSLRPVLKLLFGDNVNDKIDRVLNNDKSLPIYASSAPMWNTKFNLLVDLNVEPTYKLNPNVVNHNVTIDDNFIVSGFGSSAYLYFPTMNIGDEMILNIESYNNNNSVFQTLLQSNGGALLLQRYSDFIVFNTGGTQQNVSKSKYYKFICIKLIETNIFQLRLSNDLQEYSQVYDCVPRSIYGSFPDINSRWQFGIQLSGSSSYQPFYGKLNLKNSFIRRSDGLIENFVLTEYPKTIESDKHEFMSNIDMINAHNMIQLDATQKSLSYNNSVYSDEELRTKQGINYLYSSNIQDAVASESQIANMFKWNTTTSSELPDNTITTYSQVPGVVMYYIGQGGYDFYNTPTISHSDGSTLNSISTEAPVYSGGLYLAEPYKNVPHSIAWIWSQEGQASAVGFDSYENFRFSLKQFIPGTHYAQGRLESPQQIFIPKPDAPVWESTPSGVRYNTTERQYQAHALYHELVFKRRRPGAKENEFDFIPTLESVADNDPQGLATRLALSKNKDYYTNRPFFEELSTEYEYDTSKLADLINEKSHLNYNYYTINTTYLTNNLDSNFDSKTDTITPSSSYPAIIKSLINIGTDSDNPGTSGPDKYVGVNFGVIYDWSTITTASTTIGSIDALNIICKLSGTDIIFSFNSGNTSLKVPVADLTNPDNLLILQLMRFGQRASLYACVVNKSTNEVTTYYSNGPSFTTTTSNININITLNGAGFKFDFTPRNLSIAVDFAFGRPTAADVGMIKEYDRTNNIDRSVYLTEAHEVDRPMTDSEFYNQYKLDYETYAQAFDLPQ